MIKRLTLHLLETHAAREDRRQRTGAPITLRWVETGDPRCPLAGVWMPLSIQDTAPDAIDEPDPFWPAAISLLLRRQAKVLQGNTLVSCFLHRIATTLP